MDWGSLSCRICDKVVSATWLSHDVISCTTPPLSLGNCKIGVSNNGFDYVEWTSHVSVTENAQTVQIIPHLGPSDGGTLVHVKTAGLQGIYLGYFLCRFALLKRRGACACCSGRIGGRTYVRIAIRPERSTKF